jgi:hypothetical protein
MKDQRSILDRSHDFSLLHCIQVSSGAHPASYATEGVKKGREANHSGQKWWSYTSNPSYVFVAWCLLNHRDFFIFVSQYSLLNYIPS